MGDVGNGHVHIFAIVGRAPLDTTQTATLAHTCTPENFAFVVRVKGMGHSGFLADQQHAFSICQGHQDGRGADVNIRPQMVATAFPGAHDVKHIIFGELFRPKQLARIQIEGQDGVAGLGGGFGEIVTGAGVDDPSLGINGRR